MTTFHTAIFTREGTLGLTIAECETSAAAVVASVKPGGAAQSRRVRPGDVISKVNGRRVGGYADAARAIASAGRPVTLVLERSAQPSRSVTPEEFEVPPENNAWTKSSLASLPPPPPSPPPAGACVEINPCDSAVCERQAARLRFYTGRALAQARSCPLGDGPRRLRADRELALGHRSDEHRRRDQGRQRRLGDGAER